MSGLGFNVSEICEDHVKRNGLDQIGVPTEAYKAFNYWLLAGCALYWVLGFGLFRFYQRRYNRLKQRPIGLLLLGHTFGFLGMCFIILFREGYGRNQFPCFVVLPATYLAMPALMGALVARLYKTYYLHILNKQAYYMSLDNIIDQTKRRNSVTRDPTAVTGFFGSLTNYYNPSRYNSKLLSRLYTSVTDSKDDHKRSGARAEGSQTSQTSQVGTASIRSLGHRTSGRSNNGKSSKSLKSQKNNDKRSSASLYASGASRGEGTSGSGHQFDISELRSRSSTGMGIVQVLLWSIPFLITAMGRMFNAKEYIYCTGCRLAAADIIILMIVTTLVAMVVSFPLIGMRKNVDRNGLLKELKTIIVGAVIFGIPAFVFVLIDPGNLDATGNFTWDYLFSLVYLWVFTAQVPLQIFVAWYSNKMLASSNKIDLFSIVLNQQTHQLYNQHLVREMGIESLQFLDEALGWKKRFEDSQEEYRQHRAEGIYETFLAKHCPLPINIDGQEINRLRQVFRKGEKVDRQVFDKSMVEVYRMIERDSFIRFLSSNRFNRWVKDHDIESDILIPGRQYREENEWTHFLPSPPELED